MKKLKNMNDKSKDWLKDYMTERDYSEHMYEENGTYECMCVVCENRFIGRKRSQVCKICKGVDNEMD